MKQLIAAVIAALALGLSAQAQTMSRSDDYVCNHGDSGDPATQQACARLRGAPGAEDTVAPDRADDDASQPRRPVRTRPRPQGSSAEGAQQNAPAPATSDAGAAPRGPANAQTLSAPAPRAQPAPVAVPTRQPPALTAGAAASSSPLSGGAGKALLILGGGLAVLLGLLVYLLPSLIALARHRANAPLILLVNVLFGWSFIGWVAALIWSLSSPSLRALDPTSPSTSTSSPQQPASPLEPPPAPPLDPNEGKTRSTGLPIWLAAAGVIGLLLLVWVLTRGGGGAPAVPIATAQASAAPPQQQALTNVVAQYRAQFDSADNAMQKTTIEDARAAAICSIFGAQVGADDPIGITNWVGKVKEQGMNAIGDKGYLTIDLGSNMTISNINLTNFEKASRIYDYVSSLGKDRIVRFSGSLRRDPRFCLDETGLFGEERMDSPMFNIDFTDIDGVAANAPVPSAALSPEAQPADSPSVAATPLGPGDAYSPPPDDIASLPPQDARVFSKYSVPIYSGPVFGPDFAGRDKHARMFRTMIMNGVRDGIAYAGRLAVTSFGCGTDCSMGYVIDLSNGQVFDLPVGGEPQWDLSLQYVKDSSLLRANWYSVQGDPTSACVYEDFLWTGHGFSSLGIRRDGQPCPSRD